MHVLKSPWATFAVLLSGDTGGMSGKSSAGRSGSCVLAFPHFIVQFFSLLVNETRRSVCLEITAVSNLPSRAMIPDSMIFTPELSMLDTIYMAPSVALTEMTLPSASIWI